MEEISNNFAKIISEDLDKLPLFLKEYGNYEVLKNILLHLNQNNTNIIENIMYGKNGYEHYKQSAFFELPTNELVMIILFFLDFFNIVECHELYAGTGLLTKMLKINNLNENIKWNCSDDYSCKETFNNNIFGIIW